MDFYNSFHSRLFTAISKKNPARARNTLYKKEFKTLFFFIFFILLLFNNILKMNQNTMYYIKNILFIIKLFFEINLKF
jgi:hypothetical protein